MTPELELLLQGLPRLAELPAAVREELGNAVTRGSVAAGDYLFRQREGPPEAVFYLITATAEILVGPPEEERAVSLSKPGELVGWLSVFTRDPFPASARIVEPGDILRIETDVLRGLVETYPSIGQVLASNMARRLEDLFERVRQDAAQVPLTRLESFPFRRLVTEVMESPALSLPEDASARRAAEAMAQSGATAVFVDRAGTPLGIVTEKDLVHRVTARASDPEVVRIADVMSAPLVCIPPDAYLYRALGTMRRSGVRHLAVADGGRLVGVVSMRDLLNKASGETLELAERIEGAPSLPSLAEAHRKTQAVCAGLLEEGVPAGEVSRLLSGIGRDVHRRVLELAILRLEETGRGPAPVPFCFLVMGSLGRGENHFCSDQDHGMILADYPQEAWDRVEPYFMDLGQAVSEGLAEVGFARCRGGVMSQNPVWRKPLREWKAQVAGWLAQPNAHAVRYATVLCDFQPVWGDPTLARELRDFVTQGIGRNSLMLRQLFEEASHHRVPLTLFKQFVTERSGPRRGQMDLKRSGLLFLVECARILALRHGVLETGTAERLQRLSERGLIPSEDAEFVLAAHKTLVHFLLTTQARKLREGTPPDSYLSPPSLTIQERYLLRHALEATGRLQGLVHASFGSVFF